MSDAPLDTQTRIKHSSLVGNSGNDIDSLLYRKPLEMSRKGRTMILARMLREQLVKRIDT